MTEAEVRGLAASYDTDDAELAAPEFSIALESVAHAIAARMEHKDYPGEKKKLVFFLISDRSRDLADRIGAASEPILDNGAKALCGTVLVTPVTCHSGYSYTLSGNTTPELFQEIVDKGAGGEVAFVFDPDATDKELRYYPRGVASPETVQRFPFRTMTFTVPLLDGVLSKFHEQSLVTPDAARGLDIWQAADKYWPIKEAEARFQGLMKLSLTVAFDTRLFTVMWEVPGTQGRCDLLILSRDPNVDGNLTAHAVIELKVLRSFSSGGSPVTKATNAEAIKKGVGQARAYRQEKNALNALLCCYDMRKPAQNDGEKCFNHVRTAATKHAVQLRNYRLYGSSDDYRKDKLSP